MSDKEEEPVGEEEKEQEKDPEPDTADMGEVVEDADKGADKEDDDGDADGVNKKDVFGDDSDEEDEKPRKQSRLRQRDSDDSDEDAKKAESDKDSDDDERSPRKKKEKKTKVKRGKKTKEKKRKSKEGKEDKPKKKRKRSDGSDGGSGSDAEDAVKEKRVFEESDDDAEMRDEGIDLETGEVVSTKGKPGAKHTKGEKKKMREREVVKIDLFVSKLKKAALDDRNAYKDKKMATKKMEMLDDMRNELSRKRTQQDYLEHGVLKSLKLWLDPLDHDAKTFKGKAGSLPNRKLLTQTLEIILDLPMEGIKKKTEKGVETDFHDNMEIVEQSEIGRSVRFVQNAMESDKTSEGYKLATKVRQQWSRIIYKKASSLKKSADQMDEDNDEPKSMPKANRGWEKMPENLNSSGVKAVKGDYGFRFGASVPRPMLVDFTKQPQSKIVIKGREMDLEELLDRAKDNKNETRSRLSKIGVETVRGNTEGRNMRAVVPELNRVGGVATIPFFEDGPKKKK